MASKRIIWTCAAIGAWIAGYIPALWGVNYFSMTSLFCSAAGAMLGIWIAFKLTH